MDIFFNYFLFVRIDNVNFVYLCMAKKMISIKIEENLPEVLKQIAEIEDRSQGAQVERWIKKEAKRLNIVIPPVPPK